MHAAMPRFAIAISALVLGCSSDPNSEGGLASNEASHGPRVTVSVSPDTMSCNVDGHVVPCADLTNYLSKSLALPTGTLVGLSDELTGRKGKAFDEVVEKLGDAGYRTIGVAFITEPNIDISN